MPILGAAGEFGNARQPEANLSRLLSWLEQPPPNTDWSMQPTSPGDRLEHVYWIGGGSGAGKSTIAGHLAARRGLHLYDSDSKMSEHARRSSPERCPLLYEFMAMDMDERWVNRAARGILHSFPLFHRQAVDCIGHRLGPLPKEPATIVEG